MESWQKIQREASLSDAYLLNTPAPPPISSYVCSGLTCDDICLEGWTVSPPKDDVTGAFWLCPTTMPGGRDTAKESQIPFLLAFMVWWGESLALPKWLLWKEMRAALGDNGKWWQGSTQQEEATSILEFQKIPFVLFFHNLLVPTQGLATHAEYSKEEKLHPLSTWGNYTYPRKSEYSLLTCTYSHKHHNSPFHFA